MCGEKKQKKYQMVINDLLINEFSIIFGIIIIVIASYDKNIYKAGMLNKEDDWLVHFKADLLVSMQIYFSKA